MSADHVRRAAAFLAPGRRPVAGAGIRIRRWQAFKNPAGTMLGFLSVELPSGLVLNDCKLMTGPNGRLWIAMPAVKLLDRDGQPKLDANGRPMYSATVEFRDRATADRFRDQVLETLKRTNPEALDGDAG